MKRSNILHSRYILHSRRGFTLIEILLFAAIFSVVALTFVGVLTMVLRLQARGQAASEVAGQSQFLLQTIERLVSRSSLVEMPANEATTTLRLRTASSITDPTTVYLSSGAVYLKETVSGAPQRLTSDRVTVSALSFTKRTNPPAHDSVDVAFTISYNAEGQILQFSEVFRTSVARVSAATFDSDLIPSVSNSYQIGAAAQDWRSVNNTLFFSGSNVGVNVSTPQQALEIKGGVRLYTTNPKPSCDADTGRGTLWLTLGGASQADTLQVCIKNAQGNYLWATIY